MKFSHPFNPSTVSSRFGARRGSFHYGIDYAVSAGTPIPAIAAGTVTQSGYTATEGNYVRVDHGNGVDSLYCHMPVRGLPVGRKVKAGEHVGRVGSTGRSTGPHLHLGVRVRGVYVDPETIITTTVKPPAKPAPSKPPTIGDQNMLIVRNSNTKRIYALTEEPRITHLGKPDLAEILAKVSSTADEIHGLKQSDFDTLLIALGIPVSKGKEEGVRWGRLDELTGKKPN
jgi:murein DD-endopeptidase MepM/ murein hydrolase activator NlpD